MSNDDFDLGIDGSDAENNTPENNVVAAAQSTNNDDERTEVVAAAATSNTAQDVVNEIFAKTGQKIPKNDPMVELILVIQELNSRNAEYIANGLESQADNIFDNLNNSFEIKLNELKTLLNQLEDQKEMIVIDVWRKLEQRVMDKIQDELTGSIKKIAENSNNSVNNERLLIKGGVVGLIVGILICAVLLFVFK